MSSQVADWSEGDLAWPESDEDTRSHASWEDADLAWPAEEWEPEEEWELRWSAQHQRSYYCNHRTRTTQWAESWQRPLPKELEDQPLPEEWERRWSTKVERAYFCNNRTETTQWADPRLPGL